MAQTILQRLALQTSNKKRQPSNFIHIQDFKLQSPRTPATSPHVQLLRLCFRSWSLGVPDGNSSEGTELRSCDPRHVVCSSQCEYVLVCSNSRSPCHLRSLRSPSTSTYLSFHPTTIGDCQCMTACNHSNPLLNSFKPEQLVATYAVASYLCVPSPLVHPHAFSTHYPPPVHTNIYVPLRDALTGISRQRQIGFHTTTNDAYGPRPLCLALPLLDYSDVRPDSDHERQDERRRPLDPPRSMRRLRGKRSWSRRAVVGRTCVGGLSAEYSKSVM